MKTKIKTLLAVLLIFALGVVALPVQTQAASKYPTPSDYVAFNLGSNLCTVENFDETQTIAGYFVAPEAGNYKITGSNAGGIAVDTYLLNEAFQEIDNGRYSDALKSAGDTYTFKKDNNENIYLNSGQKVYMYAYVYDGRHGYVAVNFQIERAISESPSAAVSHTTNSKKNVTAKKDVTILKLTKYKRGSKKIKGKTIKRANVKIKIGSITYQIKSSSKGYFSCKLAKKLIKKQKVKITVSQRDYNKKVKTFRVK